MAKEEEIRASIDNIDSEILKDTLALLLSKNNTSNSSIENIKTDIPTNYKNFAQAIIALKKQYKFPELDFFTTEADLVYVTAGDRRVLLTDKSVQSPLPAQNQVTEPQDTNKQENNNEVDSIENAFEPIKPNDSRFSHLEF